MPLQISSPRNSQRSIEMRKGARVIGQPHMTGAGPADHHQILGFIARFANSARKGERARKRGDGRRRLRVGEIGFTPTMKRLHGNQIRQRQALADGYRLLVISERQIVASTAPGHGPEVIQSVRRVRLIGHGTRYRERLVKADTGRVVGVCASIGHAELDQRIACMGCFAQRVRGIDHASIIGHRTVNLAGLSACRAAPLVQRKLFRLRCGLRMGLQQQHGAIKPAY